jgi:hypothetical protein
MKAAETHTPSFSRAQAKRIDQAGGIIDRLDIARHLIMAEPVSCRLALALRILRQTVDDIAELAGNADELERREAEAIRQAVGDLDGLDDCEDECERRAEEPRRRSPSEPSQWPITIAIGLLGIAILVFVIASGLSRWF